MRRWITAVVILAVGMLLAACTGEIASPEGVVATNAALSDAEAVTPSASPPATSSTSNGDPRGRLESLGEAWLQTSATIAYRTADHTPGEATSPHQCLRQMVEDEPDDVQSALRTCLREGAITLAWGPPGRWRMDVSSAGGTFTLISTPTASYLCREVDGGVTTCAVRSSTEVENGTPFRFILLRPRQVLDEIGANAAGAVTQTSERTIAGLPADCFSAAGEEKRVMDRVEWCYSGGGILLFFSTATEEGGSTTLEATAVSTEVSDAEFVPPSG